MKVLRGLGAKNRNYIQSGNKYIKAAHSSITSLAFQQAGVFQ
mgnify:CR=1 FL=1